MTYGALQATPNLLKKLSVEHLEAHAIATAVKAKAAVEELFSLISGLSKNEQEEVRLSMQSGLMSASGLDADRNKVEKWAIRHKIESQLAMAWEATNWSASKIQCQDPEPRRKQMLKITQTAHQVWKAHSATTEYLAELVSRGSSKGSALWVSLNRS
ncbi:MAG: hypothetical protein WC314_15815 [Vulcanimicrobiota bacterium]